jgi:hypothetical protein
LLRLLATRSLAAVGTALAIVFTAGSAGAVSAPTTAAGYHLSPFISGVGTAFNPDSVTAGRGFIYIGYQNAAPSDGSSNLSSTIVQYRMDGSRKRTWTVLGKNDGLRLNPYTGKLWATRNEDDKPGLTIIDPATGAQTDYSITPSHGGGYDDLAFTRSGTFIVASAPTNAGAHVPAIQRVTSLAGGVANLGTVLYDDSTATDRATGKTVTLALSDPDSLWLTAKGELALTSQADRQVVFIKHPGQASQTNEVVGVSAAGAPEELDDSAVATSRDGFLLVVDHDANMTYKLTRSGGFSPRTAYTEAPKGSPLGGIVGTFNTRTGVANPVAAGFANPTGLLFVATEEGDSGDQGDQGGDGQGDQGDQGNHGG